MAVILYKPGNAHIIRGIPCDIQVCDEYSYLHNLDQGWFYSPEECYAEEKQDEDDKTTPEEAGQEDVSETEEAEEEPVLTDSEEAPQRTLSDDAIRAKAKIAGIRGWHNTGINKLVEKLKELESAE